MQQQWILKGGDVADRATMGGKAATLAQLHAAGLPVPDWFVITPQAFHDSLSDIQRQALASLRDPDAVRNVVAAVQPSSALMEQVDAMLQRIAPGGEPLAVRCSSVEEDGDKLSFAGQFQSFLFVSHRDAAARIAAVWQSAFAPRVLVYRLEHGLSGTPSAPAVLVQRMVNADVAGVACSADPVSGRRGVAIVSAVFGLGSALGGGEADADSYHVDRGGRVLERKIAAKTVSHRCDPDAAGLRRVDVPADKAAEPALSDAQAAQVAALARRVSQHLHRPQEIEWAIAQQQLFLLQSRPITTLHTRLDPDGAAQRWDSDPIADRYSGLTTPLTFSLARRMTAARLTQLCRILAVPRWQIEDHADALDHVLGYLRGRIGFNLTQWRRVAALLPADTLHGWIIEALVGDDEALGEPASPRGGKPSLLSRAAQQAQRALSALGLAVNHLLIERRIAAFTQRLERALRQPEPPLADMRIDELVAHYREVERDLLRRWDVPLINDCLAAIAFNLLRRLSGKWLLREGLHNDLLSGEGRMLTAEPPRRVQQLARIAAADEALTAALCDAALPEALAAAQQRPDFMAKLRDYLQQFGDRCPQELMLESIPLQDDATPLLRAVGQAARRIAAGESSGSEGDRSLRLDAERLVQEAFADAKIRPRVFQFVLQQARARLRERENLRFLQTRVVGRVRQVMLELGRRLYAERLLDEPREVFYLQLDELLGLVDGSVTTVDSAALARLRKAEFHAHAQVAAPALCFETRGAVAVGNSFAATGPSVAPPQAGQVLRGSGACPGVVLGPVRVVGDPRTAQIERGQILVASHTDPGWVMLLAWASGLIVEHGSLLSHAAIIARELNIPTVVGVSGLLQCVQDGQWVHLDGASGEVKLIDAPNLSAAPPGDDHPKPAEEGGKLVVDLH